MATTKKDETQSEQDGTAAQEKGYFGVKDETIPNSAHSLQSGPDSPSPLEQRVAALRRRADEAQASAGT